LLNKNSTDTAGTALKIAEKRESSTTTHKKSTTATVEQARDKTDKTNLKDGISDEAPSRLSTKPAAAVSPSTTSAVSATFNSLPVQQITTTVASASAARFPYTLQLACYNSEEVAREETMPFKQSGLAPFIVKSFSQRTGENLWVIYSGYYSTAEDAKRDIKRYQLSEALSARTPYAVLIGTFASAEEMSGVMTRLEQFKYSFYTIPEGASVLSLFAGAFTTRTGAEQLNLQLQADGIKSKVVLR
jgi:hypothetical protein